ncbi:MAG TPA: hypothetical protein VK923_07635, partial [Euzebyales bacterium]|nr:hypothetical protein [Euzebyales bacterium]
AGFARDNCGQLSPMAHRCTAMKRLVTNETPWPRDRDQRFSSSGLALDNRSGQGVESWRSPTREKIITRGQGHREPARARKRALTCGDA